MYFQGPVYQIKETMLYFGQHQYDNIHTLVASKIKSSNYQNYYIVKKTNQLQQLIQLNEYIESELNQNHNVQLLYQQDEKEYFMFLLFGFLIYKQISLNILIELYGYTNYLNEIMKNESVLEEYENMISKQNTVKSTIFQTNTSELLATSELFEQPLFSQIFIEKQNYSQIFDSNHQFESVIILPQKIIKIDTLVNEEEAKIQNPNISPEKKRIY